jgi:hypothetical protein
VKIHFGRNYVTYPSNKYKLYIIVNNI